MSDSSSDSAEDSDASCCDYDGGTSNGVCVHNNIVKGELCERIICESIICCIDCHPDTTSQIVATGVVDGRVTLHQYDKQSSDVIYDYSYACSDLKFLPSGDYLVTGTSNRACVVINCKGQEVWKTPPNSHNEAVSCVAVVDENVIVTGEDEGVISIWDIRVKPSEPVVSFNEVAYDVLGLCSVAMSQYLVAARGNVLSAYDLRNRSYKLIGSGCELEAEVSTVQTILGGNYVVAGGSEAELWFLKWKDIGCAEGVRSTFNNHGVPFDALAVYNGDIIVTGGNDGWIRIISSFPHKVIGVLGEKGDMILDMCFNADCSVLAVAQFDDKIRILDASQISDIIENKQKTQKTKRTCMVSATGDFFDSL